MNEYRSKLLCSKEVGHFKRKFYGEWESPTNDRWRQKTRVPGISRGVVCVILHLAALTQYRRVTDRQTHRQTDRQKDMQTHDDG